MEQSYNVRLPLIVEGEAPFEGPLDLLLHLIRENKVDIYDIPIAEITKQYLQYIALMKELSLEIAGEFLVMAATLIHIKSRMLLPVEETLDTIEPEDPRLELVERLLQYQAFKEAALGLKELEEDRRKVFKRAVTDDKEEDGEAAELELFDINLFDLINAFKKILDRAPGEGVSITKEALTVKDRMNFVIEALEGKAAVRFEELFTGEMLRMHLIVTFIALLEVLKLGLAKVYQEKEFGAIWIIRREERIT